MEECCLWVSLDREKGFQWSRKDGQEGFVSGNRWEHLWVFDLETLRPGKKSTPWSFGMGGMLQSIQRSQISEIQTHWCVISKAQARQGKAGWPQ